MPNDSCFDAAPQFGLKIWLTLRCEIAIREGHHGRANYLRIVGQVLRDNSRRFRRMFFHFATFGSYSLICTKLAICVRGMRPSGRMPRVFKDTTISRCCCPLATQFLFLLRNRTFSIYALSALARFHLTEVRYILEKIDF
jgi:hypothetical protein